MVLSPSLLHLCENVQSLREGHHDLDRGKRFRIWFREVAQKHPSQHVCHYVKCHDLKRPVICWIGYCCARIALKVAIVLPVPVLAG